MVKCLKKNQTVRILFLNFSTSVKSKQQNEKIIREIFCASLELWKVRIIQLVLVLFNLNSPSWISLGEKDEIYVAHLTFKKGLGNNKFWHVFMSYKKVANVSLKKKSWKYNARKWIMNPQSGRAHFWLFIFSSEFQVETKPRWL